MRILTTEMQYRVRQGASALSAAIVVTLGLCAAPAQAQDVSRAAFMQVAMLTGSMVPASFSTPTLPAAQISDADVGLVMPTASVAPVSDSAAAPAAEQTPVVAGNDDSQSVGASGMPLAAARIDDEQLGSQRGRNLQGAAMVKSPGMAIANGVTLWDELPGGIAPTPRPQQLSNGVGNVQVTRVTYTTR